MMALTGPLATFEDATVFEGMPAATVIGTEPPWKSALQLEGTTGEITAELMRRIAHHFHRNKGRFSYRAFDWLNDHAYGGVQPVPMIQWALTEYRHCLAWAGSDRNRQRPPVITLHPALWQDSTESMRKQAEGRARGWAYRMTSTGETKQIRVAQPGCISMGDVAHWPHSLRPAGYYETKDVPVEWRT